MPRVPLAAVASLVAVGVAGAAADAQPLAVFLAGGAAPVLRAGDALPASLSPAGAAAATAALLGAPLPQLAAEDDARAVDELLAPEVALGGAPLAVLSVEVAGVTPSAVAGGAAAGRAAGASAVLPLLAGGEVVAPGVAETPLSCGAAMRTCGTACLRAELAALGGADAAAALDLSGVADRDFAGELVCFVRGAGAAADAVAAEAAAGEPARLLTARLGGCHAVKAAYGAGSARHEAANTLTAGAIRAAAARLEEATGGRAATHAALSEDALAAAPEAPQRRALLAAGDDPATRAKKWTQTFVATSVGLGLFTTALVSTYCLMNMDVNQDSLLYQTGGKRYE